MFEDLFGFEERKMKKKIDERNPYKDDFFDARLAELKTRVDQKRYIHTLGVVESAEALAAVYHVDIEKARLAALLHD